MENDKTVIGRKRYIKDYIVTSRQDLSVVPEFTQSMFLSKFYIKK